MKRRRHRRSPEFKGQVALEAFCGRQTLNELAAQFGIHPVQVSHWKRLLRENAHEAFSGPAARNAMRNRCYQEIKRSQQKTQDELSWMMDVLQGRSSAEAIATELAAVLPRSDAEHLHWCVMNNTAVYRTRALVMLAHKKGIRKPTIWRFLRRRKASSGSAGTSTRDYVSTNWSVIVRQSSPSSIPLHRHTESTEPHGDGRAFGG